MRKFLQLLLVIILISMVLQTDAKKKKKKDGRGGFGGAGGMMGGQSKAQMIFINIRQGMVPEDGIEKMAKDFQHIMSTGGTNVGIVGTEGSQMIAIANSIREVIEIRKFAT